MTSLGYWLICIGVVGINAVLVYVAWWALFADRSRGRKRCPHCWYDMDHSPGMTCAECGFTATHDCQLLKTRRRYLVGAAAILASVVIAVVVNDRVSQAGWASVMPTRALIWMLPLAQDGNSGIFGELSNRARDGTLSDDQWISIMSRCASGDWRAKPSSDAWILKYGSFISNWRRSGLDPKLLRPLAGIAPRLDVTTRDTWPADVPISVSVQVRDWWPPGMECRVRATPHLTPSQLPSATITFHRTCDESMHTPAYALSLPPLDPATQKITIDFEIERRSTGDAPGNARPTGNAQSGDDEWHLALRQSVLLITHVNGVLQEASQPIGEAELTAAMTQVFQQGAMKWASGRSPVRFRINNPATFTPAFNDIAIGVSVELQRDGVTARRLNLWWLAGASSTLPDRRNYGFEVDFEDAAMLTQVADDGHWKLHVRSLPALALRAGKASKYWEGEFTIPLTLHASEDAAPPRVWWRED